jgi:hypothetical protein
MRLVSLSRLALALPLAGLLLSSPQAHAQKVEREKFETCDGVELHGTFYPSAKGAKAISVLLLHNIKGKSADDGWDRLAKALQAEGFAVLSFDFRGHGDSTTIAQPMVFWKEQKNKWAMKPTTANGKLKDTINYKDYGQGYYPMLVNDIAAAKNCLDTHNDSNECNSRNLIVIGAGDGATLGALWLATEMNRYQIVSELPLKLDTKPEGKGAIACVWLSMTPTLATRRVDPGPWLRATGKANKVPMLFFYGGTDNAAKNFAENWGGGKELKGDDKMTKKFTVAKAIPKTKLAGRELLKKDLDTIDLIVTSLTNLQKDANLTNWSKVDFETKGFMWQIPGRGRLVCKPAKEKTPTRVVPTELYNAQ